MSSITVTALRKVYGPTVACDSLDATFDAGSITCLLGPSGCGKTTLLRMIAGLETADSGRIQLGDADVTHLPAEKRDLGMVFQYPVVYRGLTVAENLALPLRQGRAKVSPSQRRERVDQLVEIMSLADVAHRSVDGLPNGTRQKVAVARAMIRRPSVVLFDEPVTNVDIVSKLEIQRDIKRLVRELGQTVLYVTHDQTEAMTLADRIVLLQSGRIVESGSPREVFRRPRSRFGGHFLGSPGMNFLPAEVERTGSRTLVRCPVFAESVRFELIADPGADPVVGVRPEFIGVSADPTPGAVELTVTSRSVGVGGRWILECPVGDTARLRIKVPPQNPAGRGDRVWAHVPAGSAMLFDGDGTRVGVGAESELAA